MDERLASKVVHSGGYLLGESKKLYLQCSRVLTSACMKTMSIHYIIFMHVKSISHMTLCVDIPRGHGHKVISEVTICHQLQTNHHLKKVHEGKVYWHVFIINFGLVIIVIT